MAWYQSFPLLVKPLVIFIIFSVWLDGTECFTSLAHCCYYFFIIIFIFRFSSLGWEHLLCLEILYSLCYTLATEVFFSGCSLAKYANCLQLKHLLISLLGDLDTTLRSSGREFGFTFKSLLHVIISI